VENSLPQKYLSPEPERESFGHETIPFTAATMTVKLSIPEFRDSLFFNDYQLTG
jgi:hypothetical protein